METVYIKCFHLIVIKTGFKCNLWLQYNCKNFVKLIDFKHLIALPGNMI